MRYALLIAGAALAFAVPASADIAVMANISGTANGTVTDWTCDTSGCTITGTSNFSSPFTATINDDAPSFDFSFNVNGLPPIAFNSSTATSYGIVANADELNKQFLTLRHAVAVSIPVGAGGHRTMTPDLNFTFNGMGFLQTVTGSVIDDTSIPFVSKHRVSFDIADATVTGSISGTSIAGIPEPSTWAMMLIGFGGVSMALRRKRRVSGRRQTALS